MPEEEPSYLDDPEAAKKAERPKRTRKRAPAKSTITLEDLRDAVLWQVEMIGNQWERGEQSQLVRLSIPEEEWVSIPSAGATFRAQREEMADLAVQAAKQYPGFRKVLEGSATPVFLFSVVRTFQPVVMAARDRRAMLIPIRQQRVEEEQTRLSSVPVEGQGQG